MSKTQIRELKTLLAMIDSATRDLPSDPIRVLLYRAQVIADSMQVEPQRSPVRAVG